MLKIPLSRRGSLNSKGGSEHSGCGLPAGATKYLKGIGMNWINDHVSYLTNIARERLAEIPDLTIHSPSSSHAILLFSHRRIHSHDLAEFLGRTQNVAVRSGHHCAQLQMGALGVSSACRASLYLYNTLEDIERLFEGITKAGGGSRELRAALCRLRNASLIRTACTEDFCRPLHAV
jgi:cysteine desulfurase/selenocysteine lyase